MAEVSKTPWQNFSDGDFDDAQYKRAAALDRGEGDTVKQRYGLPIKEPSGKLNEGGLRSAAQMIGQVKGASEEAIRAAARKIVSGFKSAGMDVPEGLAERAGQSQTSERLAYQTPYDDTEAVELGSKLWRKQVLPHRSISYKGGTLSITPQMAKRVVENHRKKPFEYVPFVIGHSDNPEAGRGEVVGLSQSGDGVEAIIATDDAGTKMIEGNGGKLPVSVRLLEDYTRESDGEHFGPVIQHVAATYTPRMTNMRPWEAVEASNTPDGVVDLSEESYDALQANTDDGLSDEDRALIAEVEREVADEDEADDGESSDEETENDSSEEDDMANMPSEGDKITFKRGGATHEGTFKRMDGENAVVEVDGEEVKVPVSMLQKGSGSEGDSGDSGAKDNSEGGSGVDLAELEARDRRIAELESQNRNNTLELRRQRVERELEEYGRSGVPAADLDAARPLLMDDDSGVELSYTDLSEEGASEKKSARGDLVRKMLDSRKGTVEFGEKGDESAQNPETVSDDDKVRAQLSERGLDFSEYERVASEMAAKGEIRQ